jgi:CheY-like chemotaxis protein
MTDRIKVPPTLLLADDSVTIQRVIELTFADEDVRVITVSNGDEAIAILNRTPPDIVLADVGMPGPSGYDIAQHIKDTPRLAHIPVVLLTGAFEPIDQAKAAAVGCDGVLAKPFEPQLVIGRVKELLAKPKRPAASPAAPQPPAPELAALGAPPTAAPGSPGDFAKAPPPADVGDYFFDRLDQASANRSGPQTMKTAPPPVGADIDWFGLRSPAEVPPAADTWNLPTPQNLTDLPLSHKPSTPGFDSAGEVRGSPFATTSPASQTFRGAPTPKIAPPPPSSRPLPLLADAFAALLAAEQSAPVPSGAPAWPAGPAPAAFTPDLVEQVTRSVLEQLSDRVVRETVRDVVTEVAERLVREEIQRLKSSIK